MLPAVGTGFLLCWQQADYEYLFGAVSWSVGEQSRLLDELLLSRSALNGKCVAGSSIPSRHSWKQLLFVIAALLISCRGKEA
jgi:hypothetical protein